MKTPWTTIPLLLTAALCLATGCARHEGPYEPVQVPAADVENRAQFVLLDKATRDAVTCTGLQQRTLDDGRLEVVAQLRNRLNRRLEVQASCVFKNERGFPTQDDAPFQTVILAENAQEGLRFVALNPEATTYTVRIRKVR